MTHDDVARVLLRELTGGGDGHEGVLRGVQGRPEHLGHARVQLEEDVTVRVVGRLHLVLHGAHDGAGVGEEEGAGLNLELQLPSSLLRELLEELLHRGAHHLKVGGFLVGHAPNLVAAAQVESLDGGKLSDEVQGHAAGLLPHRGIGTGPDVRVNAIDDQAVPLHNLLRLGEELVPDAKRRGRAADVGLAGAAGTQPGVEPQADLGAGEHDAVRLELRQRARVHLQALVHELREEVRELLRGERDLIVLESSLDCAVNFVAGGRVDVEPRLAEHLEDRSIGGGLHGVADGEAEGVGKGFGLGRLLLEPREVVDVGGSAELFLDGDAVLGGEEAEGLDVVATGGHRDDLDAVGAANERAGGETAGGGDAAASADGFRPGGGRVCHRRVGDAEGGHLRRVLGRGGSMPVDAGDLGKASRMRSDPYRAT